MGNSDLLTVAQAAAELGMQPDSVRRAIHQGRLQAVRLGPKATMITRAELARYASADKRPGGRPRR
jgi:excisionase family DNA binding protein